MTNHPDVRTFTRKQTPPRPDTLHAARYQPGTLLDAVRAVAAEADYCLGGYPAVITEADLDGDTVLLVRYLRTFDDAAPEVEYVVVEPGDWLTWSQTYDTLDASTTADLGQFYDEQKP